MALFLSLYLGHLIADYALQPGALVAAKRRGVGGILLHTAILGAASAVVLWDSAYEYRYVIALAVIAHFVIENLTIATRIGTRTRGLFVFLFDQTLHILSIGLLVWLVSAWHTDSVAKVFGVLTDAGTLALIDMFLTVTLLGSILAFETGGAFANDPEHDTAILKLDVPRLLGMSERGGAFALAVWVHPGTMIVAFAPRVAMALTRHGRERARLLAEAGAGLVLCLACWIAYTSIASLANPN